MSNKLYVCELKGGMPIEIGAASPLQAAEHFGGRLILAERAAHLATELVRRSVTAQITLPDGRVQQYQLDLCFSLNVSIATATLLPATGAIHE